MTDGEEIEVSVWARSGGEWRVVSGATYTTLEFEPRHQDVGTFTMELPKGRQSDAIRPDRLVTTLFRGDLRTWVPEPSLAQDEDDLTVTIAATDALSILGRPTCWPTPNAAIGAQGATDSHTGDAETVIRTLVRENLIDRYGLDATAAGTTARGATVISKPRFDNLLTEVIRLAALGGIGVRFGLAPATVDDTRAELALSFYEPADRTVRVQLSIADGSIGEWELTRTPPTCTKAIVGGSGEGAGQYLLVVTTPAGDADAAEWGGHREEYVDGPETFDNATLRQAGEEAILAGRSRKTLTMQAQEPAGVRAFEAFTVGDLVTGIPVEGLEIPDHLTAITVTHEAGDPTVTPKFGDPDADDPDADTAGRILALRLAQDAMKTNRKRGAI